MSLADLKGAFLYQVRPDIFPEGYLTLIEIELWGLYYYNKRLRLKD